MLERFETFGKFTDRLVVLLNLHFARETKLTRLSRLTTL